MVYGIPSRLVNLLATGINSALWSDKLQAAIKKVIFIPVCLLSNT